MEGRIFSYVHFNGQVGSLVKIATITDFAARTDEFIAFGKQIAAQVAMMNPETVEELLKQESIHTTGQSVQKMVDDITAILGEKVDIVISQRFSFR